MLDVYTNGFAYDLHQKLAQYGNVPVFGGSSEEQFWPLLNSGNMTFPCILLRSAQIGGTQESYFVITQDGSWVERPFDVNAFPFAYALSANVMANDQQTVANISALLQNLCSEGYTLLFRNPYVQSERVPITLQSSPAASGIKQLSYCFAQEVTLTQTPAQVPCFFFPNDVAYIGQSARIESELLNIALLCQRTLSNYLQIDPQAKTQYWERKNWVCEQLGIPERIDLDIADSFQPREVDGLFCMVQAMCDDPDIHVGDAFQAYLAEAQENHAASNQASGKSKGLGSKISSFIQSDFMDAVLDEMGARGSIDRDAAQAALDLFKNRNDPEAISGDSAESFVKKGVGFLLKRR